MSCTPLADAAASLPHDEAITMLIDGYPNIDEKRTGGLAAVHYAARYGHLDLLKLLITKRCDVNAKDCDNDTPLHYAASSNKLDCVKCLADAGADAYIKDKSGQTPLDVALQLSRAEIVNFLQGGEYSSFQTSKAELTKVQPPVISSNTPQQSSCGFPSPAVITLASATLGAIIYFTLDGSTPDNTKLIYGCPIALIETGLHKVRAIAKAAPMKDSDIAEKTFNILEPVVRITSSIRMLQLLTCRDIPGKRFEDIVPKADSSIPSILSHLRSYADEADKNKMEIQVFEGRLQDSLEDADPNTPNIEQVVQAKSLIRVYTAEGWIYEKINEALREDCRILLPYFAPIIRGITKSFAVLSSYQPDVSPVYRRVHLGKEFFQFYKPDTRFMWPGFTSASTRDLGVTFGDVLFVITIPNHLKHCALNLREFSNHPLEDEVLLISNMGFHVTAFDASPDVMLYPDTTAVIDCSIQADFDCLC